MVEAERTFSETACAVAMRPAAAFQVEMYRPVPAEDMKSCANCGRTFHADKLARHEEICEKVFGTKRRPLRQVLLLSVPMSATVRGKLSYGPSCLLTLPHRTAGRWHVCFGQPPIAAYSPFHRKWLKREGLPTAPHPTRPHPTPPHPTPHHPTPPHTTPHHATLHHATPYHAIPHHASPHHTMVW